MHRYLSTIKIIFFVTVLFLSGCVTDGTSVKADDVVSKASSAEAYVTLGMEALEKEDVVTAKQELYQAYALAPRSSDVLDSLAYFHEVTGELQNAAQIYQQAIAYNPNDGDTYNDYGTFLCRHDEYQKAIKEFTIAANEPTYLYVAAAYENAGLCAAMIPDDKQSEFYLKRALMEDPNSVMALFELARLSFRQGDQANSKQYYQRLVDLHKVKADDYMSLMLRKQAKNNYDKFGRDLTPVVERSAPQPNQPVTMKKKPIPLQKINLPSLPLPNKIIQSKPVIEKIKPAENAVKEKSAWGQTLSKKQDLILHHEPILPNP